jgi:polyhydroxybutyrate depolymerase
MIELFLSANKCLQVKIDSLPNQNASDGSFIIREKHESCLNNNQLWFYKVVNGGHDWPGASGTMDINASEEIWKFFSLFVKK